MQIRDRIIDFRRVRAKELRPHPRNWRTHPKRQQEALRGILAEIGYADALLARETPEGLQLVDGHLRAETTPDQEVPVLILDLDEKEAEKLLVSLDPLAAMAGQNDDLLRDLLSGIETQSAALKEMWSGLAVPLPGEGLTDPDAIPEPPEEPVTRPGDLWILGGHRLLCADSSKAEDVDRLLAGAPIHLVNTDPPYNVKVEPRSNNAIAAGLSSFTQMHHQGLDLARHPEKSKPTGRMRAKDRPLQNDFVPEEEFGRMVGAWFGNVARVLLPGRGFYIWGGYSNLLNFPRAIVDAGLYFSQTIIWLKGWPVLTRKDYMGDHEWCYYGWKLGAAHYFNPAVTNATDVWSVRKTSPQSMVHLTEKPVELAERAMQYSSREGENVLDLFGGSGSTLIAAQRTRRRAFLMEIDAAYCDVICQRYRDFTGKDPVREDGTAFPPRATPEAPAATGGATTEATSP
jgi:DNA modification methylase